jgi:hypothetical protein
MSTASFLSNPSTIEPREIARLEQILRTPGLNDAACLEAVYGLAAAFYSRPEIDPSSTIEALSALLSRPRLSSSVGEESCRLLRVFGTAGVETAYRILSTPGLNQCAYDGLARFLRFIACWHAKSIDLDRTIELTRLSHLSNQRLFILRYVIERLAWADPSSLTPRLLERVLAVFGRDPEIKYLAYLMQVHSTDQFPLHRSVGRDLGSGPRSVLVVHNIRDGQGDEIARTGSLLQAFVDHNPELRVVIITRRSYLYDHPRIECVPIHDDARVERALAGRYDVAIDFYEPVVTRANYRPELEARLREFIRKTRPPVLISSLKGYNRFVFETVSIKGRDWASRLGLNTQRIDSTYETSQRLIAELGLPLRVWPSSEPSVFAAADDQEATSEWKRLTMNSNRPVAVVNPYGGIERLKGFTIETRSALVKELEALVEEGYRLLLFPNGTPWGSAGFLTDVVAELPQEVREHIVIGPDPGAPSNPGSDQRMRCLKYFMKFADVIIAVEGWMMHMAYHLRKPCRVVMMPYSHSFNWQPFGSACQTPASTLSFALEPQSVVCDSLADGCEPPLARYPRKEHLLLVLRGLGLAGTSDAMTVLRRAAKSPDREVRLAAYEALLKHEGQDVQVAVLAALNDKYALIRKTAALFLLGSKCNFERQLGPNYISVLNAHVAIAESRWQDVLRDRKSAIVPISIAIEDENDDIKHDATWALKELMGARFPVQPTS